MRARSLAGVVACLVMAGRALPAPQHLPGHTGHDLHKPDLTNGKASDRLLHYHNVQADHGNALNVQAHSTDSDTETYYNVFYNYTMGLYDLLSILNEHKSDEKRRGGSTPPSALATTHHHEASQVLESDIQGLFAFVSTMKKYSDNFVSMERHHPKNSDDALSEQGVDLPSTQSKPPLHFDTGDGESNLQESREPSLTMLVLKDAVQDLTRIVDKHFHGVSKESVEHTPSISTKDGIMTQIAALESLVRGHELYTNILPDQRRPSHPNDLNSQDNHAGLQQIIGELKNLVYNPAESKTEIITKPTTVTLIKTPTTTTTTTLQGRGWYPTTKVQPPQTPREEAARHRPCESPFEEIAYRMCILQETTLKLSWGDARDYCRRRGAELAQDAVVIKTRRFLNDLYGESGTRSRWPIWVGGIERSEGGERVWKWVDGSVVPSFIWSDDQPRPFTLQQAPDGTCMFLDGYKRFYAASLPCHLKRRFVCQRHD
ncbi:uncharacterized protein [Procambarus clarkii]|uniref:uncharacterized protein isoform X2 n=1 Tax=Procambarus clarkii TaxID=6728 RepID=UPI001E67433C|nr:uncharacterized protein LOC123747081 isoform X2 [Procambarus clarkii]